MKKFEIIETGRLSKSEMTNIAGGGTTCMPFYYVGECANILTICGDGTLPSFYGVTCALDLGATCTSGLHQSCSEVFKSGSSTTTTTTGSVSLRSAILDSGLLERAFI
jgi:hypothetical protein